MTENLNLILPIAFAGSVSAIILARAAFNLMRRRKPTQHPVRQQA